ncbi:MAG: polyprenol phosphomannose-dependent alpha 1,6 mannosyltransferase MptB [Thermocrispum sp.]
MPWLHGPDPDPLNGAELRAMTTTRRLGIVGALFLAVGSIGAGAVPVLNPATDIPVVRLFARATTVSLAIALAGMLLMVIAWLLYGRYVRPGRARMATPAQTFRTVVMWITPLLLVPPLFSRDVYSYLAQSEIVHRGLDPYTLGPAQALGVADPITMGVSNVWRETPAPYGPLFLEVGNWMSGISGNHVAFGVLLQRGIALVGVGLIVWSLPRLARRFGVQPTTALWLGAANPLVIFHLVAGAHNEALGIGLMMAGLELGLRRLPIRVAGDSPPPLARGELGYIVLGASVLTLAAAVKINAALALGFFGVMIARRWHGRISDLLKAAAGLMVVFLTVLVAVCLATGLGFGWIGALGTPGQSRTLISPVTLIGYLTSGLGIALDLGVHVHSIMDVFSVLGLAVAAVITVILLWRSFRWQLRPIIGLGVAMAVVMGLHVAVHPWWMLWAVVPLAASAGTSRFRVAATIGSAILAVVITPTGSPFDGRGFVLPQAYLAALVVVVLALLVVRRTVPLWRDPAAQGVHGAAAPEPSRLTPRE